MIMNMNSVLVLPIAREERLKSGDPRPSLAERYPEAADRIRSSSAPPNNSSRTGCCL
jgi:hypothetical protein